ncbi:MAG: polysaccharide biosynthesis protein [bacterium]
MGRVNLRPTPALRGALFLTGDLVIWTVALWGAFMIRFDGVIPPRYMSHVPLLLALLIPIKLAWHAAFRLYQLTWRSVGLPDLLNVAKANALAMLTVTTVAVLFRTALVFATLPRSVLLLDFFLATCGVAIFRAGRRGWQAQWETLRKRRRGLDGTRLLIIGAGAAGTRIIQTMQESADAAYRPVGFIDDDPAKWGAYVRGLKVFGDREALSRVVREQSVEEVLIAIPSAPSVSLRGIIERVRHSGVQRVKVLPGMHEWMAGRVALKDIRDINLQDLLGRPAVHIQYDALKTYLAGKRVLVTGAAGSIGSELVHQLSRFPIEQLVAADINESGLFELEQELSREVPDVPLRTAILDVRDAPKVNWMMSNTRPHLVFHAAAYKHVPMMEREVEEAVKTNIFGTQTVGEASLRSGVETFVFVSTDKAVNPSSVMGASKRAGELVVQALSQRARTRFLAVRFGNVLGSRGSIVPVLLEQIRRGGPVTITHPDMARYFMSVAEAVLLVLQTPLMTTPGSVFMLDMGEPVRIVDLVRELIRLAGLEADKDIPIVFSGIRAGEKLEEELVALDERLVPTVFERIMEVRSPEATDEVTLRLILRELDRLVRDMDVDGIRALLGRLAQNPAQTLSAAIRVAEKPETG